MSIRIAINGFGRIGRNVLRIILQNQSKYGEIEVVSINDLTDSATLAHLFKYDSIFGIFNDDVSSSGEKLKIGKKVIKVYSERDPVQIPWKEENVDIVVESTGFFRDREKASAHLEAGVKKVVITAPAKNEDATIVMGVNEDIYDNSSHHIISNASCTTNCLAPVVKVLNDTFGIEKGVMTTIHSYTNDQKILDAPHSDLRRARAAAMSMIPTTTGAAKAVTLVIPEMKGKLDGGAIRVPTPDVSIVDFVCTVNKEVTEDEINSSLKEAADGRLKGILEYSEKPLVSIDYTGNLHSSIVDSLSTKVVDGNLVKVLCWYDNESGYSARVIDLINHISK